MEGQKGGRERKFPVAPPPLIQKQAGMGAAAVSPQSPFHLDPGFGGLGPLVKPCATWGLVTGQSLWAESAMELVLGPRLVVEKGGLHLPWPSTSSLSQAPLAFGTISGNKN